MADEDVEEADAAAAAPSGPKVEDAAAELAGPQEGDAAAAAPPGPSSAAAAEPTPVVLQSGQVIQGYEIVKPLGKGKFSIVYMAKHLADGLMCALKKINIFDMMVPKQREKCLKEVRLLQSLDHPNIVRLLNSFIDNHDLLIIVEWAEKGDLKRLIRKALSNGTRFREDEIWEYSRQLSGALEHMHKKRIMHRDLKPANIFVSLDGSLKLGDLGLGRFFSSQTLEAFSKVGTPLYMSPEVLHGAGYDMRSDVWSLGCVLYELAMLKSPFKSEQQLSLYDLFVRISKGQYPPLPETTSSEFRELINNMLKLEPGKRLESEQVLEVCVAQAMAKTKDRSAGSTARSGCRPSPLLVMDDIVEKLKLLECEERVLRPRGFPLLHRCFFTQRVPLPGRLTQFDVMYELMQWLLGMLRAHDEKPLGAVPEPGSAGAGGGSGEPADLARSIAAALKARNIQISSDVTLKQLQQGYGEGVCLILNELINQELMSRDFHFEAPAWGESPAWASQGAGLCGAGAAAGACDEEVEEEAGDGDLELTVADAVATAEVGVDSDDDGGFGQEAVGHPTLEPIIAAHIDPEAWRDEAERVRPRLKVVLASPGEASGWRGSFQSARHSGRRCEELRQEPGLLPGVEACGARCGDECARLRGHEDRLNAALSARATELAQLRDGSAAESEQIGALQGRVAELSETLESLTREVEQVKAETSDRSESIRDPEPLTRMRDAMRRLRDDQVKLEVRVQCLQVELLSRRAESQRLDDAQ
eukprot:CAMPEP_0180717952 /NCGR_PEP_ID=MMETSP1038_2-20121128/14241_1 /TAXON_ID=632150 /ORGANISM="Azadinium spinosum, Strain 3D9" /LENGTH=757 /DNA_ID=CAMNT_0022750441 /DNA_START=15 /DNA_END=2286 /DNA_ORIENTATION=-